VKTELLKVQALARQKGKVPPTKVSVPLPANIQPIRTTEPLAAADQQPIGTTEPLAAEGHDVQSQLLKSDGQLLPANSPAVLPVQQNQKLQQEKPQKSLLLSSLTSPMKERMMSPLKIDSMLAENMMPRGDATHSQSGSDNIADKANQQENGCDTVKDENQKKKYGVLCQEKKEIEKLIENDENQKSKNDKIFTNYSEQMATLLSEEFETVRKEKKTAKKYKSIDIELKRLERKRTNVFSENKEQKTKMAKIVEDKGALQKSIEQESKVKDKENKLLNKNLKDLNHQKVKKMEEIEKVLNSDDISSSANGLEGEKGLLLEFITTSIEKAKKDLECPVCLEIATTPIFQCPDSHLICSTCLPKITVCPECRCPYVPPVKRHRYAEKALEELHSLYGKRNDILHNVQE